MTHPNTTQELTVKTPFNAVIAILCIIVVGYMLFTLAGTVNALLDKVESATATVQAK